MEKNESEKTKKSKSSTKVRQVEPEVKDEESKQDKLEPEEKKSVEVMTKVTQKANEVKEAMASGVEAVKKDGIEGAKKNPIIMVGLALAIIVVLIVAFCFIKSVFSSKKEKVEIPLVYMVDGELKFITSKHKKAISVGESDSDDIGSIRYSSDGKKFLYTENDNLYVVEIDKKGEKEKIASDVQDYGFSENDKYVIFTDEDDNLFSYNFKEKEKLDSDIDSIESVIDDMIFYEKDNSLYVRSANSSKDDKSKITSDYNENGILFNEKKTKLLYSKQVEDEPIYDYYVYDVKSKKSEKVLSDAYKVFDYSDDFKQFVYVVQNDETTIDLSELIEDDMKEADENFKEYKFKDYLDDKIDYETYSKNQDEADKVKNRNNIREKLKSDDYKEYEMPETYDVYYISGNKKEKLASGIDEVQFADYKTKRAVVSKKNVVTGDKIKISEIDYISDITDKLESGIKKDLMVVVKDKESKIVSTSTTDFATIVGDDVYVLDENKELFHATINGDKLGDVKSLGEDVSIVSVEKEEYEDGILFMADEKDSVGDLKTVKNGKVKLIDNDVYSYRVEKTDSGRIYYFKNFKDGEGDYYYYNGKAHAVLEDVGYVLRMKDDYMYVLKDYSSKSSTYDLYRYKGKKLELIDYGVDF